MARVVPEEDVEGVAHVLPQLDSALTLPQGALDADAKTMQAELDRRLWLINADGGTSTPVVATPRAGTAVVDARTQRKSIIDPTSRHHIRWSASIVLLAVYSLISTGYQLAFPETHASFHHALVFDWMLDVVFVVQYVLTLRYLGRREGAFLVRPSSRRYALSLRGMCDVCACLPLDVFQGATGWHPGWRVLKLLRISSLRVALTTLERATTRTRLIDAVGVARLVLFWLLMPHLAAVGRILLARNAAPGDTWAPSASVRAQTEYVQYLHSFYWAMGTMTGYADGSLPSSAAQHVFTLFLLNLGLGSLAYTVGALSLMDGSARQRVHAFERLVPALHRLVQRHPCIPKELEHRLTSYILHRWENIKMHKTELADASVLLSELPSCVRNEAVQCMTARTLSMVPLFANCETGFMFALTQRMEAIEVIMGEDLIVEGSPNDCMYVVLRGLVAVIVQDVTVSELGAGGFFGEQSLLSHKPAGATVHATSFCELYRLRRQAFMDLRVNFVKTFEGFDQAVKLAAKRNKANPGRKPPAWAARLSQRSSAGDGADVEEEPAPMIGSKPSSRSSAARLPAAASGRKPSPPKDPWIISPNSRLRAAWAALLMACLLYEAAALPFKLVFIGNALDPLACGLDVLSDVAMCVDCLMRFRLAYLTDGRTVTERSTITKRYLHGAFGRTAVTAFPFTLLMIGWPRADARALQAVRIVRLSRLAPWFLRSDAIAREQPSNLDELLRILRRSPFDLQYALSKLLPLVVIYGLLVHACACCYWAVVMAVAPPAADRRSPAWHPSDQPALESVLQDSEWMPTAPYLTYASMVQWYLRALYFATCNLTGLGKDMVPLREGPLCFTLFCFVVGVLAVAYLTSAIVTLVMQADAARTAFAANKLGLLGFMERAAIDQPIIERTEAWLEHSWHAQGGMALKGVLEHLPRSLGHALKCEIFASATRTSLFFGPLKDALDAKGLLSADDDAEDTISGGTADTLSHGSRLPPSSAQLVDELIRASTVELYNRGEWILRKGMLNETCYVVAIGGAKVMLNDSSAGHMAGTRRASHTLTTDKFVAELGVGDVFGEVSSVYRCKCDASVLAGTALEVIAIPREAILRVLHQAQPVQTAFLELVRKRRVENEYYRHGRMTVAKTITMLLATTRIKRVLLRRVRERRANYELRAAATACGEEKVQAYTEV